MQLSPSFFLFFSSVSQIQIWPCHIWLWGSFSQGIAWWYWLCQLSLFQNASSVNFALKSLNSFEFATVFCKFKWYHVLYCLGRKLQGLQWWCPCDVLCNSSGPDVKHLAISNLLSMSLPSFNFSACWILIICSFQVSFMSSPNLCIIKPAPSILSYAMWLGFHPLLHLPGVKFIDTTPSPKLMFYFHVVTTSINFLDDHAMLTCYLHLI